MILVFVFAKMLFLLESTIETVNLFLRPLRKYIGETIRIEDQIKGRKAIWLLEVERYLRVKLELELRSESLVEQRKVEIVNNNIIIHIVHVKWKDDDPETYQSNLRTLLSWKHRLINKFRSIEACYT